MDNIIYQPKRDLVVKFKCQDCDAEFSRTMPLGLLFLKCPGCGSKHIKPAGFDIHEDHSHWWPWTE